MNNRAFTLIELLVVIAIIAILSVVVILTLNPASLLQQSRDSTRLSDISVINNIVGLSRTDQLSLGNASTIYVSLPDPSLAAGATSTCAAIGLSTSSIPAGWNYQCASAISYKNTNGTGWIPINFKNMSAGSPVSFLPVDPTNQSSSGLYYKYTTDGTGYAITASIESAVYATDPTKAGESLGGNEFIKGSSPSLAPLTVWFPNMSYATPYHAGGNNFTAVVSAQGPNSIASVQFLVDGSSIGTVTSSPYSILVSVGALSRTNGGNWLADLLPISKAYAATGGTLHTLKAIVTDSSGATASTSVGFYKN